MRSALQEKTAAGRRAEADQRQDRRSVRTRSRLVSALMALLHDKPLKSITVKELTDLADVNRATFYAHYSDVFDMAGQMRSGLKDVFRSLVETHAEELEGGSYRGLLADVFGYFDKNEEAISVVLGPNADGSFLNDIIEVMRAASLQALAAHAERGSAGTAASDLAGGTPGGAVANPFLTVPELCNYHFYFLAGGVSNILKSWVAHGRREPIEVMVDCANNYVEALMGCLEPNAALFERAGLARSASGTGSAGEVTALAAIPASER